MIRHRLDRPALLLALGLAFPGICGAQMAPMRLPADAPRLAPDSPDIAAYLSYYQTLAALSGQAHALPETENQQAWDARFYDLDLHPNVITGLLTGSVRVLASVIAGPITTLDLDFDSSAMQVDAATSAGAPASFTHASDLLTITLDRAYATGEIVNVTVSYHGTPPYTGYGGFRTSSYLDKPHIWTLSEPFGAHTWYPCKDQPADKADSVDVRVTVPTGMITAGNGVLLEKSDNGTVAFTHWRERHPITTYLVSLASYAYAPFSDWYHPTVSDSMEIQFYYYPDQVVGQTPLSLTVKNMLSVFATRFGDYPFLDEKYGHAEILFGGGEEHQTCTSIGSFQEYVVAHELSHQWWGDLVTCRDFHHIWLNEGFATYCEALWLEAKSGPDAYHNDLEFNRYLGAGTIYRSDLSNVGTIFDGNLVYNKGSWVLHMLRHVLGDSTFFDVLRDYRAQYAYSTAVTEDFQHVCEVHGGLDLTKYFQQWIYGERYPIYLLDWSSQASCGGWDVTVSVQQTQPWQIFWMPIDVTIQAPSGDSTFVAHDSLAAQVFTFHMPTEPTQVLLDKDEWILRSSSTSVAVESGPLPHTLELAPPLPNPSRGPATIALSLPHAGNVRVEIVDLAGRRVARLHDGPLAAGVQRFTWDGRVSNGGVASAGVYWVSVEQDGERRARPLVRMR